MHAALLVAKTVPSDTADVVDSTLVLLILATVKP
jgi:hypothetical protein